MQTGLPRKRDAEGRFTRYLLNGFLKRLTGGRLVLSAPLCCRSNDSGGCGSEANGCVSNEVKDVTFQMWLHLASQPFSRSVNLPLDVSQVSPAIHYPDDQIDPKRCEINTFSVLTHTVTSTLMSLWKWLYLSILDKTHGTFFSVGSTIPIYGVN